MSVLEDAVAELKKVGYTDEKIAKLLELILPEVQEEMLLDLAGICTEEELAEYENRLEQARTKQDIEQLNEEMAKHAYGDQFKEKIEEMTSDHLNEVLKMTLSIRKTYHDYMSGDPDTVRKVKEAENSEDVKKWEEEMKAAGIDYKALLSE